MSDAQVQFADDPAGKTHQNLLSNRVIGIRHEEIRVLDPPTEPRIVKNNKPELIISTWVIQAPQARKLPMM